MIARWLDDSELRIGLGCMRLPDDVREASDTVAAAWSAGMTVFDTARAYAGNEELLARALRECGAAGRARIVTKGGMTRSGARWIPDGRARTIRSDCEASLRALGGLPVDLYLLHAPDARTPWTTSVRALGRLLDERLVRRIGVSNVNRAQLEQALELADISAVEIALNPFDDHALRGGVVELCERRGVRVIAHSPLGGPRRVARLGRIGVLDELAKLNDATPAQIALAWLLDLSPLIVPIPGARRPESVRSAARAAEIQLTQPQRASLATALGAPHGDSAGRPEPSLRGECILVMGIPGAGKSVIARQLASEGYVRLNRDERGGTLRDVAAELDRQLSAGGARVVLDNTYLTRAARSHVIEIAHRHGVGIRCVWLDTTLAEAQVNMVARLLDRFGRLPAPEELRDVSRREPGLHSPTSQMRTVRELEPPAVDEGFDGIERREFVRDPSAAQTNLAVVVAAGVLQRAGWERMLRDCDPRAPHLVYDWCPGGCLDQMHAAAARLSGVVEGHVDAAMCPHEGGPPACWCRPPLPGLPMAFARARNVDLSRSIFVGTTPTHQRLAAAFGARYVT